MTTRLAITALLLAACSDPEPPELYPCAIFDSTTGMHNAPASCTAQCLPDTRPMNGGGSCKVATYVDRTGVEHEFGCFLGTAAYAKDGSFGCCIEVKDPALTSYWMTCEPQ